MNTLIKEEVLNSSKNHIREVGDFICGAEAGALEEYLKSKAFEDAKTNKEKIYLIKDNDNNLIGYYSIRATAINYKINNTNRVKPYVELSSLAVDYRYQRKKYGTAIILMFVFQKVKLIADILGCSGIITFALDDQAKKFYESLGFEEIKLEDKSVLFDSFDEGCIPMVISLNQI